MKKIYPVFIILFFFSGFMTVDANTTTDDTRQKEDRNIIIQKTDVKEKELFQKGRPQEPHTPDVPRFALKDKNDKFMLGFGGFYKPIFGWDIGNVLDNILFIPADIPVPAQKGNKSDFFANPMHSALSIQMIGLPGTRNQVTGYLKVMYNAPKSTVQVHHLFVMYRGLLLGKTSTLFKDGAAIPETIDPQGPNGAVSAASYRASYEWSGSTGWRAGIALELPSFDKYPGEYRGEDFPQLDGTQYYSDASQPVPDIPAYIQYKWKGLNSIRLSGIMRNFFYRDKVRDNTLSIVGWGAQVSGMITPVKPLTFYYQAVYGKGIGNYIQDLNGVPLSYIPKDKVPGKMTPTPMLGWFAGFNYRFGSEIVIGYTYSQARVWDSGYYYPDYHSSDYMVANLFYPIRDYLTFGVEWLWGRRAQYGTESAHLNRIQTMLKLSF